MVAGVPNTGEPRANICASFSLVERSRTIAIDQVSSVGQTIVDTSSSWSGLFCGSLDCGPELSAPFCGPGSIGAQPEQNMLRLTMKSISLPRVLVDACNEERRRTSRVSS